MLCKVANNVHITHSSSSTQGYGLLDYRFLKRHQKTIGTNRRRTTTWLTKVSRTC